MFYVVHIWYFLHNTKQWSHTRFSLCYLFEDLFWCRIIYVLCIALSQYYLKLVTGLAVSAQPGCLCTAVDSVMYGLSCISLWTKVPTTQINMNIFLRPSRKIRFYYIFWFGFDKRKKWNIFLKFIIPYEDQWKLTVDKWDSLLILFWTLIKHRHMKPFRTMNYYRQQV